MQSISGDFTQADYDKLRFELTKLEMLKSIGEEADEDRIKEIKEILKREVGHEQHLTVK